MRIIEENKTEEIIHTCNKCGCKFAYSPEDDTYSGLEGSYVDCPKCQESIMIKKFNRPAQFPESYYCYDNGVHIESEKIEEWVKTGIKYCLTKNEDSYFCGTGDSWVEINRYDGDDIFNIIVAQGYYSKDISTEDAKKLINY